MTTTPAPTARKQNTGASSAATRGAFAPKNTRARFAARAFVPLKKVSFTLARSVVSGAEDVEDVEDASPAAAARAAVNASVRETSQSARFAWVVATPSEDGVASAVSGRFRDVSRVDETDDAYVVSTANVAPVSSVSATTSARSSSVVTNAYAQSVADFTSRTSSSSRFWKRDSFELGS